MSNTPKPLSRAQLAKFLPDPRALRAFEQSLKQVSSLLPEDIVALNQMVQDTYLEAALGTTKADQALDQLTRIAKALEMLSIAPPPVPPIAGLGIDPVQRAARMSELTDASVKLPASGNVLIYDAALKQWKNALLTPGTNVTVTNADGAITISVSNAPPSGAAGGVLSGTYPNPGFAVDMATQAELDAAIATREPTITAGTTSQFWRGDKSWQDFFTSVRAATLTGLSTATNAVITAADTVLSALGKLQKQISDHFSAANPHTQYGLKSGALSQFTGSLLPAADYTATVSTNSWVPGTFYQIFAPGSLAAGFYLVTAYWFHTGGTPYIVSGCFTMSVLATNAASNTPDSAFTIMTSSHLGDTVMSARAVAGSNTYSGLQISMSKVVAGNISVNAYKLA